jgi:hypothetical protein
MEIQGERGTEKEEINKGRHTDRKSVVAIRCRYRGSL